MSKTDREVINTANSGNSKLKLLYLYRFLNEFSDEEHPLTSADLCGMLEKEGISCERKSIYRDISVLMDFGVDVIRAKSPHPGFFVANRDFELPEVRLLMDAVLTAPFITNKKTAELTEKLQSLLSRPQAASVSNQMYVDRRIKFDNEEIYYSIDAVNRAVETRRQISFVYHHKVIINGKPELDKGREFTISPYALVWASDKYYLAGNYGKYNNVSNYRLDRMKQVAVTDQKSRPFSEVSPYKTYFDTADYLKRSFNMYSGEQEQVELRCSKDILEAVADKFGDDIQFFCLDENAFTVRARVYVSDGLVEWLLQYGDRIVVQKPKRLRQAVVKQIQELAFAYGD